MSIETNSIGEQQTDKTTVPLSEAVARALQNQDQEFCDSFGAKCRFSLGRSHLYALASEGKIRGISLRKRGATKGRRLWDVASIRAYINSQAEGE